MNNHKLNKELHKYLLGIPKNILIEFYSMKYNFPTISIEKCWEITINNWYNNNKKKINLYE